MVSIKAGDFPLDNFEDLAWKQILCHCPYIWECRNIWPSFCIQYTTNLTYIISPYTFLVSVYKIWFGYSLYGKAGYHHKKTYEPAHDKTNKMACAPSEDSDQPGHPPSLIRVFAICVKKAWVLSYPLSTLQRLWSDCADAQADLILCWVHLPFCWFCRVLAHMILSQYQVSSMILYHNNFTLLGFLNFP